MFPHHVEPKLLQKLQIRHHRLSVRWCVQAIWPVSLIQRAELEHKLAVE